MNNKDISTDEAKEKEESSDEHIDSRPYSINNFHKIILDIDDNPDLRIEKILINIFNSFISPDINENESFDLLLCQKKIKVLCLKNQKSQIIFYLLTKIRSLINKYREKIFELPNIIELKEKMGQRYYIRSSSHTKIVSDNYISFGIDRPINNNKSYPKEIRIFDYYTTIKNLFCELKNIKNCLEKTAPIIEKIFEIPLSEFEKFSIYECEKEDYLRILIHDEFIWKEIVKNRKTHLSDMIKEITEDDNKNITAMSEKIEYFKQFKLHKKVKKIDEFLKIAEIGSSKDHRFPEDAKPVTEIKYYENYSTEISSISYFQSNEEEDRDEYSNTEEQNIQNNDNINNIDDEILFNKIKDNIKVNNKSKEINQNIITKSSFKSISNINNINTINIKEDHSKYIDILKKNNDINTSKDTFDKAISFNNSSNIKSEINSLIDKNLNIVDKNKQNKIKLLKNKEKFGLKNKKEIKKENNNDNSNKYIKTNKKSDKKEIPSDIDDLVNYIINDDKTEKNNKKKKKNKKKNKKNKNEIKIEKEEEPLNEEEKKNKMENEEYNEFKNNLIQNSINRYKSYKPKLKYKPEWLEKISNYLDN
jgi:hypothetical protein